MPRRGGVTDHNAAMNNKAETNMATHQGHCFCGAVEIEVNGAPEAMGYCHCNACRSWSAAPVNAFTLWKPENVKVTTGAGLVGHFMKTSMSDRQYCTKCGGHLMTNHPPLGMVDVYAATIPSVAFTPASRQLCRDGAAHKGWAAQAQGLPGRNGRLGNCPARISRTSRPSLALSRTRWPDYQAARPMM